jgi:hypothetical protein
MPAPSFVFNNSTGSDTAASGAGPSTAVTGTAAAHTGGSASTTITLTNSPDLSNVLTDGTHALWLKTASGRQFSKITGKDNTAKTVTVENSFNIASGSAVDYAIGGKRATIDHADSRKIFTADWLLDWSAELQYTGSDYTLTSALNLFESGSGGRTFKLFGTGGRVTVRQTANAAVFGFAGNAVGYSWMLQNLKLCNSNATKTSAHGVLKGGGNAGGLIAYDVIFGDATNTLNQGVSFAGSATAGIYLFNCEVQHCTGIGVNHGTNGATLHIVACHIHDNGSHGIYIFGGNPCVILQSIIETNAGDGVDYDGQGVEPILLFEQNTVHANTGHGLDFPFASVPGRQLRILGNNFTANGGYGVRMVATPYESAVLICDRNNYGLGTGIVNSSGARLNIPAGPNDVAVDPQYADAAGGDFTTGENVARLGYPAVIGAA